MSDLNNALQLLCIFKEDETLNNLWKKYQISHSYAMNISFSHIIDTNNNYIENKQEIYN